MRRALAAPVCLLALLPVIAQQPQPQQPVFRAGVDVVAVDVHVVDSAGRPVPDLKTEEFAITVDGRPRPIIAADYVSHGFNTSAIPAAPEAAHPEFSSNREGGLSAEGRTILLVVDEENIRSGSARAAARAAGQFLERLQPADQVGLVVMPRTSAAIDPTTDRARVEEALTHISGHLVSVNTQLDTIFALGVSEAFAKRNAPKQWAETRARECSRPSAPPSCPSEMDMYAEAMMADARQRGQNTTRTIVSLMDSLAQLPGPKTLVYISEELPVSEYLSERAEFNNLVSPLGPAAAKARATFYVLQLDRSMADVEDRYENPSGQADADMRAFGLETVTSVTGGRRMMVSGKVEAAFDRVALEISGYYLLGFRSEAADRDGKGHEIRVAVTRNGVEVRARKMFAHRADAAAGDKNATESVNRMLRSATTETGIPMSVATYGLVEPASGAPKMRVLITAEIDRAVTKEAPFTVGYSLTDGAGRNAGAAVEQVTLKPAVGHPDGPLVYTAAAIVPPGTYTLRVAAADSALRLGSVAHRFEARPAAAGTMRLSELVVFDPYAAEAGRPRPSVSATVIGQLTCYLEAYTGGQETGELAGSLTGRLELAEAIDSAPRASVPLEVQQPDDAGRLRMSGSVPLDDVPPGDYIARAVVLTKSTVVARVVRRVNVTGSGVRAAQASAPSAPAAGTPPQPAPTPDPVVARPAEPVPAEAPTPVSHSTPAVNVTELMPRVAAYIQGYAEQMSVVVGVEHYGQWLEREDFGNSATGGGRAISRQLVSEFALVRSGNDWDGFRNVYEVDGKPVPDSKDRIAKLFAEKPASAIEQSRKIGAESSRYNMGALQRNFNVPTVALFFLSGANQGRFRFTKDKDDQVGGVRVWKVKLEETQTPTIIRTSTGKDMPVKGEAWIDPVEGRVLKTHMQIDSEMSIAPSGNTGGRTNNTPARVKTTASVTVTYAFEPKLGILVPAEMLETYEAPMRSAFTGEDNMTRVNCRATYSDFRRFETSARIVVPK
jgi:VWFA-related protein